MVVTVIASIKLVKRSLNILLCSADPNYRQNSMQNIAQN